jgi:AsmA-like protein
MSDTYSESIPHVASIHPAQARTRPWIRLLKWAVLLLVFLWIAAEGISLAIQHTRLRRVLTSRIATAFGRPVEVGSFDFNLWNGPALEAESVTVGEDPRFGQEYFLRAESITVRLRWVSLLRGHLELGTLSLTRPSLNLVRNSAGDWNLVEWLPQPPGSRSPGVPVGPSLPSSPLRFGRIEVDGGRINFKNGDEKLPFAFVTVKGTVETDRPGRWRMNLDATPWRAAVVVQQAGTIHLSGDLGGTSSRLRPAALDVSWTDASISDVLRLAGGNDFGTRGALAMAINARTREQDDGWVIQGRAQLQQVHRWDLALRPDTPSLNLIAKTNWNPASSDLELTDIALEAPHSSAHASGRILWNRVGMPAAEKSPPVQVAIASQMDVGDLLPWLRAFHAGVAESLSVRGGAELHGDVRADPNGWPLHVINATLSSAGLNFSGADPRKTARLGQVQFHFDHGVISISPLSLSWGTPAAPSGSSFHVDFAAKPSHGAIPGWHVAGSTTQVRDLIAGAGALGLNISRGWDLAGPFACDFRWQGIPYPWSGGATNPPVGWLEFGGSGGGPGAASLRAPFLNQAVDQIKARAEWKPGSRHIALASAQAFGAKWSGTFDSRDPARDWQFVLSADHLAAADLDRWLNPAWRQSFLGRMLPFLNSHSPSNAGPENLRAGGRLTLDEFALAPFAVRHLQGDVKIEGRHIEFTNATGQFYGGQVGGSLRADLQAAPSYHAELEFSRVDMPLFVAATPTLAGFTAESAAGQISFDARGATRADLLASLACQGSVRAAGPELLNSDLPKSLGGGSQGTGSIKFSSGSATFSCARSRIDIQSLTLLTGSDAAANGSGTVDFSRNLDLRFHTRSALAHGEDAPGTSFRLTGPLAAPRVVSAQPSPRRSR